MNAQIDVALTGHRPKRLDGYNLRRPYYDRLRDHLADGVRHLLVEHDRVVMHSGMALGADTCWAQVALHLRDDEHLPVSLVAHIPFPEQARSWSNADRARWRDLVEAANTTKTHGQMNPDGSSGHAATLMHQRNRKMVDAADAVVALWDGQARGGTYATVEYAHKTGTPVWTIHPDIFRQEV